MIKGKMIAKNLRNNLKKKISSLSVKPELATILIGKNQASALYVRMKDKVCASIGIKTNDYNLPNKCSAKSLHNLVNKLNNNKNINGILIEKPYQLSNSEISTAQVDDWIKPSKDIDGTNTVNFGKLARDGMSKYILMPCTPQAIISLLEHNGIQFDQWNGLRVAILSRSGIVGLPLAFMMIHKGAEVTVYNHHARANDISNADIIVAATGQPDIITSKLVNPRQILIPVSEIKMNDDRLHGDFTKQALNKAQGFSQLGNVGPLTTYFCAKNTYQAYKMQNQ